MVAHYNLLQEKIIEHEQYEMAQKSTVFYDIETTLLEKL
jgi:hypothetical protein